MVNCAGKYKHWKGQCLCGGKKDKGNVTLKTTFPVLFPDVRGGHDAVGATQKLPQVLTAPHDQMR